MGAYNLEQVLHGLGLDRASFAYAGAYSAAGAWYEPSLILFILFGYFHSSSRYRAVHSQRCR